MSDLQELLERLRPPDGYVHLTITGSSCVLVTKEQGKDWSCTTIGDTPIEVCERHIHKCPITGRPPKTDPHYGVQQPGNLSVYRKDGWE